MVALTDNFLREDKHCLNLFIFFLFFSSFHRCFMEHLADVCHLVNLCFTELASLTDFTMAGSNRRTGIKPQTTRSKVE